jgi:hypothetical protein
MRGKGFRGLLVAVLALVLAAPAGATIRYGPIQLSGSIDSQNLVRTSNLNDFSFVQNRNTALLRFEYDWIKDGLLWNKVHIPFVKRSQIFILYRGVYDGFYDIAPGGNTAGVSRLDELVGGPIEGNRIGQVNLVADPLNPGEFTEELLDGPYSRLTESSRDKAKFENTLREAYIDFKLQDLPLSFRVGRQQVIWGESDSFRLMDIWNPLDLTWHLQQEEWDKIRIPLWMIKGIWDIGSLGPLSNVFVEGVWNPGDFQAGVKTQFLPYPWSVGVPNPVRSGQVNAASPDNPILLSPNFDLQGTSFRQGDFNRNPEEASDVGVRFHGVSRQGIEFTLNYLYIRGRGIGAQAGTPFGLKIDKITSPQLSNPDNTFGAFEGQGVFPAEVEARFIHPYSHVFGLTGNYFESNFTNAVLRMEMAYQLGAPFQTRDGRINITETLPEGEEIRRDLFAPIAFTKRDVWAGMVGFDRPTWIRWLNRKTTWFLTGQFFWSYVNGKVAGLRNGLTTASDNPYFTPAAGQGFPGKLVENNGVGRWTSGPFAGQTERLQNSSITGDLANNVRRWEALMTFAGLSFYQGGTIMPFFAVAYDPVNTNMLVQLRCDYFVTNTFIIQPQAKIYTAFGREQSLDPWGAGGLNRRRDELGVKVTYTF